MVTVDKEVRIPAPRDVQGWDIHPMSVWDVCVRCWQFPLLTSQLKTTKLSEPYGESISPVSLNRNSRQVLLRLAERDGTAVVFNECTEPFGRQGILDRRTRRLGVSSREEGLKMSEEMTVQRQHI